VAALNVNTGGGSTSDVSGVSKTAVVILLPLIAFTEPFRVPLNDVAVTVPPVWIPVVFIRVLYVAPVASYKPISTSDAAAVGSVVYEMVRGTLFSVLPPSTDSVEGLSRYVCVVLQEQ
jgi:hypothetical protein